MTKQEYLNEFLRALEKAAARMTDDYFRIEFCDPNEEGVLKFRERVFCYELYYQLRVALGGNFFYKLHGELDKVSHDTYKHSDLKNVVPDFIVHEPGTMNNLLVMEIKHKASSIDRIESDFEKLRKFKSIAGYYTGISYVFGKLEEDQEKRLISNLGEGIILFLHRSQNDFEAIPKK